jgi:hypothetical protein
MRCRTALPRVEAFVIIKLLDDEGHVSWSFRTTHVPNKREILGALIEQSDLLRERLVRDWDADDDEEDGDEK